MSRERQRERERVSAIYRGYSANSRKQAAWRRSNPGNAANRDELRSALLELAHAELSGAGEILDVGCGTGWLIRELASGNVDPTRLTGLDVIDRRLEQAASLTPRARFVQGDARALPFEAGRFTCVIMLLVLSDLSSERDVLAALSEAKRVLSAGGLLISYEARVPQPFNKSVRFIRRREFDAAGVLPRSERNLTLVPAVARRLGPRSRWLHAALLRVPLLRTHRVISFRRPAR